MGTEIATFVRFAVIDIGRSIVILDAPLISGLPGIGSYTNPSPLKPPWIGALRDPALRSRQLRDKSRLSFRSAGMTVSN
jgi:hypothetical protein